MKIIKKAFLLCLISFSVISCASVHLPIPGETAAFKHNIYTEYYAIADAYYDLAKYDKAVNYYSLSMKNKDLYWSSYYKLAKSYVALSNWNEAEKIFKDLLKRDSSNINLMMSLAYVEAMNNNLVASEKLYQELWTNNPDNADVLSNYINVKIALEKYDDAKELAATLKEKFKDNKNISSFEKYFEDLAKKEAEQSQNQDENQTAASQ